MQRYEDCFHNIEKKTVVVATMLDTSVAAAHKELAVYLKRLLEISEGSAALQMANREKALAAVVMLRTQLKDSASRVQDLANDMPHVARFASWTNIERLGVVDMGGFDGLSNCLSQLTGQAKNALSYALAGVTDIAVGELATCTNAVVNAMKNTVGGTVLGMFSDLASAAGEIMTFTNDFIGDKVFNSNNIF
jgi:hypothetical protein